MFIFGANVDEVNKFREEMWKGKRDYVGSRLKEVFDAIKSGTFGDLSCIHSYIDTLINGGDHYMVCYDFYTYLTA